MKKKRKFEKTRRGKLKRKNFKNNDLRFGVVGLKSLNSGIITDTQLESARQAIARKTNRKGKIWIRINTLVPITSKPVGSRMGKGKGKITHKGYKSSSGSVIFEICGVKLQTAIDAFKTGGAKLPVKTSIIT